MAWLAAGSAAASGGDPFFGNVTDLLHFNGTVGSASIINQKTNNWTAGPGSALSSTAPKFGNTAFAPYATTGGGATAPLAFPIGTGDFTVEMWLYQVTSGDFYFLDIGTEASSRLSLLMHSGSLALYDGAYHNGTDSVSLNTWHHFAVTRASGTMRLFLDGNLQCSYSDTRNLTKSGDQWYLGRDESGGSSYVWRGYIDEFRATLGVARYTASFAVPAAAFADG